MWSISDFASAIKARGFGRSNALLIGFEGSARLLGNDLAAVALTQLQLSSTGTSFNTNEIQRAWRSAGAEGQYRFLKSAFGVRQPNVAAIQSLACVIREAHIGVIVATDPVHSLHQELVKFDVVDAYAMFNCCKNKVDLLERTRENLRERPLFIDGGEVLIDGLIPGVYGLSHQDSQFIYETLRRTSTSYDKTICWGWSNFNTSVEKFWTSESGRYFVLGKDSENNRTFLPDASMDVVDLPNHSQSDIASLKLLQAVADELCPGGSAAKQQAPIVSYAQTGNLQNAQTSYASSPLLCDERAADGFIRESRQKSLAVIGVDSALVRSRLASLLGRLIVKNKDLLEHEPIFRLEEITERIISFKEEPENLFWVIEFVGGPDLPLLAQPFYEELAISLTTNPKLKTLLLVPSFYAEEIERSARGVKLCAETLTFEKVFVPDRLRVWLKEVFPEIDGEEEKSLAEEMCRVASEIDGEWTSNGGLDEIHLALNRWWRFVEFTDPDMTDLEHVLEMWREALECFARRSGEFQDESDWGIRPRSFADDLEEWELRVVSRPRRDPGPQQS